MLFFILYKIGEFTALVLPLKAAYAVADIVSYIKYFFSFCEKKEMVENLRIILPDEDTKTLKRYSRQIFTNFSRYLVDFFRFKKLDLKYMEEHVEIINKRYVDEALQKGRGAIMLSAHVGNWELGGAVMGLMGYPINVVALEHKNKSINDFFVKQRKSKNETIIPLKYAVRKCLKALADNELIGIVADKDYTNNGIVVKFFGTDTLMPIGPAAFNLKTGAAIVPGYLTRVKDDNFQLIFEEPIKYCPTGDFAADIRLLTEECTRRLENAIRKDLTQWYCFRRFWLR